MTHYLPTPGEGSFGIAPNVDTSFFTLLLQDSPGLTIFSQLRQEWIKLPVLEGAFVVNTGEFLRQWFNDEFLSTRHFGNNKNHHGTKAYRYSVPFFNANTDYPMECLPSCHAPDRPT